MARKTIDTELIPQVKAMLERIKKHNKHMSECFDRWLNGKREEDNK